MLARFFLALALLALSFSSASAQQLPKPDDTVSFELAAEDWVTAKTAHVTLAVEAAISGANEGSMRADMIKAINDAAKGDWKETGFNRSQDQTGMERWSVTFDARLPESTLNGLADALKKASKAGMQITIADIDFAPTLEEMESARATLRAHIMKEADDLLSTLNSAMPGRGYRISQLTFMGGNIAPPQPRRFLVAGAMASATAEGSAAAAPSAEHSQKLVINAHVTYAALPPAPTASAH